MTNRSHWVGTAIIFVSLLLAGCALPTKNFNSKLEEASSWRGRLAVRLESEKPQSFSAGFELTGTPLLGEMTLFNPLGGTAAVLTWDSQTATMRANGDLQHFRSLNDLIHQAIGAEVPVGALFSWLAGDLVIVDGWSPDLSDRANGRITAKRTRPDPLIELRVVLDK